MMMTGQAVAHPGQVIHRAVVFNWYDYQGQPIPVYADGTWRAEVEPGHYGIIYFGAVQQAGPQPYVYPKREAMEFSFEAAAETPVKQGQADFIFNPYPACQPVCHGPYFWSE
jgi:hypothetical protein